MKKARKIITLVMAAVLLMCATVAVTVAYLQDETDVVKNTFAVGNVEIDLDEADVNVYGELLYETVNGKLAASEDELEEGDALTTTLAERVKANEYKLIPGHTYVKDPTVHVEIGSEESFVFMKVVINKYSAVTGVYGETFLPQDVVTGWDPAVWVSTKVIDVDEAADTATYVFYYHEKVADTLDADEPLVLAPLFTEIVMDEAFDYDDVNALKEASIDVTAYAIQADGFDISNAEDLVTMQKALGLIAETVQ